MSTATAPATTGHALRSAKRARPFVDDERVGGRRDLPGRRHARRAQYACASCRGT